MACITVRLASAACIFVTISANAAGYPDKPIRILTPFSAGSITDILARPLAVRLNEAWGQPVVIDNRTGAGGTTDRSWELSWLMDLARCGAFYL